MVSAKDVEKAYIRIKPYITKTRLEKSVLLSDETSTVYMKMENEQAVGRSYKIRGVLAKLTLLSQEEKKKTLAAISSGNHGVSLCYGASLLGLRPPVIFAPHSTPGPKREKIIKFGGQLNFVGDNFDQANEIGEKLVEEGDYTKVDSREDPLGVTGQGTVALEIMRQEPDIDILMAPIGSGGLITACASYLKERYPGVKIIGVEPGYCPAMSENIQRGRWTKFFPFEGETILDSLVGGIAYHSYERAGELVDEILFIEDKEVKEAMWDLLLKEKVVVEPDSAVCYAAFKKHKEKFKDKKTAMIITGANVDEDFFIKLLKEEC